MIKIDLCETSKGGVSETLTGPCSCETVEQTAVRTKHPRRQPSRAMAGTSRRKGPGVCALQITIEVLSASRKTAEASLMFRRQKPRTR